MSDSTYSGDEIQVLPLHQFVPGAMAPASPEGMTMFIKKATEDMLEDDGEPIVLPKDVGAMSPATLLGAVTYCYASDVYESERIERKFIANQKLKSAVGVNLPRASAIRRFRKLNRSAILSILEKAFLLQRGKQKQNATPGEETTFMARSQAEQKLQLASLLDPI